MAYKKWNEQQIKEQIDRLLTMYMLTNDNDYLLDVELCNRLIDSDLLMFPIYESFKEHMAEETETYIKFQPFYDSIKTFAGYKGALNLKLKELNEYDISISELLSFVHDFYASLDHDLFRVFKKVFNERKNNLQFTKNRSITAFIPHLHYSYININKDDTINDYLNIVHKYMHAICDNMYYRRDYTSNYPFIELPSLLMELIAYDWLADGFTSSYEDDNGNVVINNMWLEDIMVSKGQTAATILKYAKYNLIESDYLSKVDRFRRKRETLREMKKMTNTKATTIYDLMKTSSLERTTYSIAYITAIELYYLYLEDPERALYVLKELIMMDNKENYERELEHRGINLNEHAKKHLKSIRI